MPNETTIRDVHRPSIYEHILAHLPPDGPGLQPGGDRLPDEPEPEPGSFVVSLAPGLRDEIVDPGSADASERIAAAHLRAIEAVLRDPSSSAIYEELVANLAETRPLGFIEPLVNQVDTANLPRRSVRDLALRLATRSSDRTPVKVGIALLAVCAEWEDREVLITLGRHEELTRYVGATMQAAFDDTDTSLWELAKVVNGWGRIELVRLLASTTDPEITSWILREGSQSYLVIHQLAFIAATTGGLVWQLRAEEIDDELIGCAANLIATLIEQRRYVDTLDIDDYEDGPETIRLFVAHVSRREERLELFQTVAMIVDFLELRDSIYLPPARAGLPSLPPPAGWSADERARTATFARWVLQRAPWRRLVEEGLRAPEPWTFQTAELAARWLGVDTMPAILDRVSRFPQDEGFWMTAARLADGEQWQRLLDMALEQVLRYETRAGHRPQGWADLLGEASRFPGTGWPLFHAALQSPIVNDRHFGLSGLHEAFSIDWPKGAEALVRTMARSDSDDRIRQRATEILAERANERSRLTPP